MSVAFKNHKRLKKLRKTKLIGSGQIAYITDRPITIDEFCDLVYEDDNIELVDGIIVERIAVQNDHEDMFRFTFVILGTYIDKHKLGIILGSRTLVPISLYTGVFPDILFVSKERENIIEEKRLIDAPDLVIEILSPGDRPSETMQRLSNYEQIGVKEFWIIDQPHKQVRVYLLDESTKFFATLEIKDSVLRSKVIKGFWLKVDWLWQKPLPSVLEVFKEITGDEM